jgi:Tfp pilus assembly protein PilX
MRDQRGIALPLTLMMVMALMSLSLALLSYAAFEPAVSRNLAEGAQARFAAEAGLERALDLLADTPDWSSLLSGADPTSGVQLIATSAIGTLPATRGTFAVRLRNDTQPGDVAITGLAVDADPARDDNRAVIVTSTGAQGSGVRTLQAAVKRLTFPPGFFPAALSMPGNEAEAYFNGNSFEIDGRGWRTDGTLDPGCQPVYGIAVSAVLPSSNPGANEVMVQNALSAMQKDNVKGKPQDPSLPAEGDNTVAADPALTPERVKAFIDQAKQAADIVLESRQPSGLSFTNVGATCATDWNSPTCWGTADRPKIVWIRGEEDPTSQFAALRLSGNTEGHGILIVEDGDLRITGNFAWYGAIIVTGKWVGVGYMGGGNQQVYGAVISNETATDPGYKEGWVSGNAKIRYSCQALANAVNHRGLVRLTSWREVEGQ